MVFVVASFVGDLKLCCFLVFVIFPAVMLIMAWLDGEIVLSKKERDARRVWEAERQRAAMKWRNEAARAASQKEAAERMKERRLQHQLESIQQRHSPKTEVKPPQRSLDERITAIKQNTGISEGMEKKQIGWLRKGG